MMLRTRGSGQHMLQSWIVCMRKTGRHDEQDRGQFATTRDSVYTSRPYDVMCKVVGIQNGIIVAHAVVRISYILSPTLAGQDDIEQSESSFTEAHLDHINMAKLEM
ncbi:hypothetical protein AZE42_01383 [Rhizopogon vesiculosus]|uniref:Uncharacterized protein n=1 Tax=Rhizopogon vesiculosus TaxID=180088 RepID=A0A1J8QD03_9AGAM|nr:hypothetical protein AZE42_01383 [Rhizopogon vesiculosus]